MYTGWGNLPKSNNKSIFFRSTLVNFPSLQGGITIETGGLFLCAPGDQANSNRTSRWKADLIEETWRSFQASEEWSWSGRSRPGFCTAGCVCCFFEVLNWKTKIAETFFLVRCEPFGCRRLWGRQLKSVGKFVCCAPNFLPESWLKQVKWPYTLET